ncbi:Uncharacterised protein [Mycobacteroides abscessus subsp. abscessus]|nr:Uncharacterised protein [Mycobacteroides abscessus subsp. abscessus]
MARAFAFIPSNWRHSCVRWKRRWPPIRCSCVSWNQVFSTIDIQSWCSGCSSETLCRLPRTRRG